MAKDSGFTEVVVELTSTNALTSTAWNCDRDLDYFTSYFWKVRAVSEDSYSEWGVNTFTTEAAPSELLPPESSTVEIEPVSKVPAYVIWLAIGIGAILVAALLVFILRTRR